MSPRASDSHNETLKRGRVAGLDPEAVELANAYGPYTHGTWAGQDVAIGNEEALAGRGAFMASMIRASIVERYTDHDMRTMTLVDVGCYDGWLLCQLEDLPFERLIGIEPRAKNIEKGRMIRELLGIPTRCEFRQGSIQTLKETLAGDKANVVVCAGLIHHLASTADAIARLHEVVEQFLFLECVCFPANLEDDRLRKGLELKDLPYFFGEQTFGVSGHKLESGYYDGSATQLSVVSVPSVAALKMFLDVQGFDDVRVIADPSQYSEAVSGGYRTFSATCITATKRQHAAQDINKWIGEYEGGLVRTLLPAVVARALYDRFCLGRASSDAPSLASAAADMVGATSDDVESGRNRIKAEIPDRYGVEILTNMRYAPADKAALEYGKTLLAGKQYPQAEEALLRITRRLNADWRSVYRAFCLLAWSCREQHDTQRAERYEELCLIANPLFPRDLLQGSQAGFELPRTEKKGKHSEGMR